MFFPQLLHTLSTIFLRRCILFTLREVCSQWATLFLSSYKMTFWSFSSITELSVHRSREITASKRGERGTLVISYLSLCSSVPPSSQKVPLLSTCSLLLCASSQIALGLLLLIPDLDTPTCIALPNCTHLSLPAHLATWTSCPHQTLQHICSFFTGSLLRLCRHVATHIYIYIYLPACLSVWLFNRQ